MKKRTLFSQLTLYRYRYIISTIILSGLLLAVLFLRLDLAPVGLSQQTIDTVVRSDSFMISQLFSSSLIDAPYHILQQISLGVFGLNNWGIALPSITIAIFTAIIFTIMIKRWFRLDIGLITSLILVTSVPFLTVARGGVPTITLLFWLSLILLLATIVLHGSKRSKLWQSLLVTSVGLSLYTPLMVYALVAVLFAGFLHPHVRYILRRTPSGMYVATTGILLVILTPLVITIASGTTDFKTLLGAPDMITRAMLQANVVEAFKVLFGFNAAVIGDLPKPLFLLPVAIIALLGLIKTVIDHHSARSYMLLVWLVLLVAPIMLSPMNLYALIVPVLILFAIGLETIIREWYKLFPRNPYARIGGLIPLSVLIALVMSSGMFQYFYGQFYGESNTTYHSAFKTTEDLAKSNDEAVQIITSDNLAPFYSILARENNDITVDSGRKTTIDNSRLTLVHREAKLDTDQAPDQIIARQNKNDSLLLEIYRPR